MKKIAISMFVLFVLLIGVTTQAQAEERKRVYRIANFYEDHEALASTFASVDASTRDAGQFRNTIQIPHDGSELVLFHKTYSNVDGYTACARWEIKDESDTAVHSGFGCGEWLDAREHETVLASAEESAKGKTLVVDYFQRQGAEEWDGAGERAPGTVVHERFTYQMINAANAEQAAFVRSAVEKAINEGAEKILRCAHPTAGFKWAEPDLFYHRDDGVDVKFSIVYKCRLTNRLCFMSIVSDFTNDGEMKKMEIVRDTAKTNAKVGLKACEAAGNLLKKIKK